MMQRAASRSATRVSARWRRSVAVADGFQALRVPCRDRAGAAFWSPTMTRAAKQSAYRPSPLLATRLMWKQVVGELAYRALHVRHVRGRRRLFSSSSFAM